jgi:hypothetical protein
VPHDDALKTHAKLRDSLKTNGVAAKSGRKARVAELFKDFASRMSEIDPKGTPRVIGSLKSYLANYDSEKGGELPRIEDYTEYRILNVGFW